MSSLPNQWRVLASHDGLTWHTIEETRDQIDAQAVLRKHAHGPLGQVYAYWMAGAFNTNAGASTAKVN